MESDADRKISSILGDKELFLIELGRFSRLFSDIEAILLTGTLYFRDLSRDDMLRTKAAAAQRLRTLEKRDLLKHLIAEVANFYGIGCGRVSQVLDELGNFNRLRRAVIHGRIRWSELDERPLLVDSQGQVQPAWPGDLMALNLRLLDWKKRYCGELGKLSRAAMLAYDRFLHRLLQHGNLPSKARSMLIDEKLQVAWVRYRRVIPISM
jgi:hypothetical protein